MEYAHDDVTRNVHTLKVEFSMSPKRQINTENIEKFKKRQHW